VTEEKRVVEIPPALSLEIRRGVYEEAKQIRKVANSHPYTKHFSYIGYCNRPNFANGNIIVAVVNEQIIGFVVMKPKLSLHETEIDIICVAEEWRSGGIGVKLLDYVVEHMPTPILVLSVQTDNTRAIAFYERYGFKCRGELTVAGTQVYRMRKLCKRGALL
jgi:ribosomal protein S18 acetylase RimI-like enzyme